jgi:hypothetical protein
MASEQPVDAKAYYGYLFEQGDQIKKASKILDALLRAIGQYIVSFLPMRQPAATWWKLATAYEIRRPSTADLGRRLMR